MNLGFTLDPYGTVGDIIESWRPKIFDTEWQYEESLEKKLKKELKNQKVERQYIFDRQIADIVIDDKVPIELKKDIKTGQDVNDTIYKLERYLKKWSGVFLVICGNISNDNLKVLEKYAKEKEGLLDFFGDTGINIILKNRRKIMGVAESFNTFCNNIRINKDTRSIISSRYENITQRLNKDFWNKDSKIENSIYVGSYGRKTAIKGFSDLDMIFKLPRHIYLQYDEYRNNGQSVLLYKVRDSIKKTFDVTDIRQDGQVVVVKFSDNIIFEVVPAFVNNDNIFTFPDSNDGGSWRITNPIPEIEAISSMNKKCNHNLKNLCKMTRAWKDQWNVPIGGLLIDTLAHNFIKNWNNKDKSYSYYDYLSRDFFKHLSEQNKEQKFWSAVGSNQKIYRKGLFEAKAKKCYELSLEAIESESKGYEYTAKSKWREIFGTEFPN